MREPWVIAARARDDVAAMKSASAPEGEDGRQGDERERREDRGWRPGRREKRAIARHPRARDVRRSATARAASEECDRAGREWREEARRWERRRSTWGEKFRAASFGIARADETRPAGTTLTVPSHISRLPPPPRHAPFPPLSRARARPPGVDRTPRPPQQGREFRRRSRPASAFAPRLYAAASPLRLSGGSAARASSTPPPRFCGRVRDAPADLGGPRVLRLRATAPTHSWTRELTPDPETARHAPNRSSREVRSGRRLRGDASSRRP